MLWWVGEEIQIKEGFFSSVLSSDRKRFEEDEEEEEEEEEEEVELKSRGKNKKGPN